METPHTQDGDYTRFGEMLAWLQSENRRLHAQVAQLQEQVAQAMSLMQQQAAAFTENQEIYARLRMPLARIPAVEDQQRILAESQDRLKQLQEDQAVRFEKLDQARDAQFEEQRRLLSDLYHRLEFVGNQVEPINNHLRDLVDADDRQQQAIVRLNRQTDLLQQHQDQLGQKLESGLKHAEHVDRELVRLTNELEALRVAQIRAPQPASSAILPDAVREFSQHISAFRQEEEARRVLTDRVAAQVIESQRQNRELMMLQQKIENQREQVEAMQNRMKLIEYQRHPTDERFETLQRQLDELNRIAIEQLTAFQQIEERRKRRHVQELEAEIRELRERVTRATKSLNREG